MDLDAAIQQLQRNPREAILIQNERGQRTAVLTSPELFDDLMAQQRCFVDIPPRPSRDSRKQRKARAAERRNAQKAEAVALKRHRRAEHEAASARKHRPKTRLAIPNLEMSGGLIHVPQRFGS